MQRVFKAKCKAEVIQSSAKHLLKHL